MRRRPSWGRGIIRKKKIYKKGTEEEDEGPEAEVETAGPSDSCLTQDEESSCDTTGPQPNGHHPHVSSTEEESSNEPPVEPPRASEAREEPTSKEDEPTDEGESVNKEKLHCHGDSSHSMADGDSQVQQTDLRPAIDTSECSDVEAHPKHTGLLLPQVDCVNGNESMDSLDSQSLKNSTDAEKRTPRGTSEHSARTVQEEHGDRSERKPTQEHPPENGGTAAESVEEDEEKEGTVCYTSS